MNEILQSVFKNQKIDFARLAASGFEEREDGFYFCAPLWEEFELRVTVKRTGDISAEVYDRETGDPFTLFLAEEAQGEFVGTVREKYEAALKKIATAACETEIFQSAGAKSAIAYIRDTYRNELEFLWEKDDETSVWRRSDNKKWYGVLMKVSRRKFGLPSDERAEVVNLRMEPAALDSCLDGKNFFRGWHMNKKHWASVLLDGGVTNETLYSMIDESYRLAKKSK